MSRLVGAGVLCFSRDVGGDVWVLLGKERDVVGWRQGSRKWGAFSGRAEEGESAAQAAAREFVEETCGAVGLSGAADVEAVWRELQEAPFVELTLQSDRGKLNSHVTFLCEVPYDADVSHRFAEVRAQLLHLDVVFREFYNVKKKSETLTRLISPGFVLAPGLVTTNFRVLDPNLLFLECCEADGSSTEFALRLSPEAHADARRLHASWLKVLHFVQSHEHLDIFSHPAVRVVCHAGRLTAANVNKAFLEKTDVAWWRLSELERLSYERWKTEDFRRYFLDNMRFITPKIRGLVGGGTPEEQVKHDGHV